MAKVRRFFEQPKVQVGLAIVGAVLLVGGATVAALFYLSDGDMNLNELLWGR